MKYLLLILTLGLLCSCKGQDYIYNDVHNPENEEYLVEVAFNNDVSTAEVTQEQFDKRYCTFKLIIKQDTFCVYSDYERPYGVWLDNYYHEEYDLNILVSYLEERVYNSK